MSKLLLMLLISCSMFHNEKRVKSFHVRRTETTLSNLYEKAISAHPGKTGVVPLADGEEAFVSRILAIRDAQRSVDLQYFLWSDDRSGKLLVKELVDAAKRGVKVRLLLDSY